jgi:hypothetical protein
MFVSSSGSRQVMRLWSSGTFFTLSCDFHNVLFPHSLRFSPEETATCSSSRRRPVLLIPVESTVVGENTRSAWVVGMATPLTTCDLAETIQSGLHTDQSRHHTVKFPSFGRPATDHCSGPLASAYVLAFDPS